MYYINYLKLIIRKENYLLKVNPLRTTTHKFDIRLNAMSFKDLQDKVSRPIIVSENIKFHKSLIDRFIDAFKEEVDKNPFYETSQVWKFYYYPFKLFFSCFLSMIINY
jgi:hypothetical protein